MKPIAVAMCLLFATSLMQAQTPPAAKAATGKADPAKAETKKEEELPKIPGTVIVRPNGSKLGLEVVGGKFKLTFYDNKHKPMTMDVTRARVRWPNPRAPGDNRTVLNGTGTFLVGVKPVIPPLNFNVFLTLLQGEGDEAKAVENYTVPFKG